MSVKRCQPRSWTLRLQRLTEWAVVEEAPEYVVGCLNPCGLTRAGDENFHELPMHT